MDLRFNLHDLADHRFSPCFKVLLMISATSRCIFVPVQHVSECTVPFYNRFDTAVTIMFLLVYLDTFDSASIATFVVYFLLFTTRFMVNKHYSQRLTVSYVFVGGFQNQRLQLTEAFIDAFATPSFD